MHAAAQNLRGGVSPRGTLLRGQSIIEYVLIAAVIGLVIVFAGPSVAGAIRNQFNQVTNTVDSGTEGDNFISAEEKAYREAMKSIASKEAKDWTLDEQKAAATDIAKNGTSSVVYAKAKAAMDAGTTWSVKLTSGKTMTYRIIGINHDDLADGSGKAGLTFWARSVDFESIFNSTDTNAGGWEASELRAKMNSGEIWNLMPSGFQSKVKSVRKLTNNVGGDYENRNAPVTSTTDKLFLPSCSELTGGQYPDWAPWTGLEGSQYELFVGKVTPEHTDFPVLGYWTYTQTRLRSVSPFSASSFGNLSMRGNPFGGPQGSIAASKKCDVNPAWCF